MFSLLLIGSSYGGNTEQTDKDESDFANNPKHLAIEPIENKTVDENSTLQIQLKTNSNKNKLLFGTNAVSILKSPFSFNSLTGLFIWVPGLDDAGVYNILFNVTDGKLSDKKTVRITVNDLNSSIITQTTTTTSSSILSTITSTTSIIQNATQTTISPTENNTLVVFTPLFQQDGDNDGILDIYDNCPSIANPGQQDVDNDGVGDACDFDDVDTDTVLNIPDNCKDIYNPTQTLDPFFLNRGIACSSRADIDGDGVIDLNDNCVLTVNPSQIDTDVDGLGDACDGDCSNAAVLNICSNSPGTICTTDTNCPAGGICQTAVRHTTGNSCSVIDDDFDVDGVVDNIDNCPTFSNPLQQDSDGDGIGDMCDNCVFVANPGQQDSDNNGIGDACDPGSGTLHDFNYNITAETASSSECKLFGFADANASVTDKFIVNITQACGADIKTINNVSITFNGSTYYGNPDSDIFVTNRNQRFYAWIVSNPELELHAARKAAETLDHPFAYEITASGTLSPIQNFSYKIIAKGREDYTDFIKVSDTQTLKMGGAFRKKCEDGYYRLQAPGGYQFISAPNKIKEEKKGDSNSIGDISKTNTLLAIPIHYCNRVLLAGWTTLGYEIDANGTKSRDWSISQSGGNAFVVNGQENKLITTYTKGFGSGKTYTHPTTIQLVKYDLEPNNPNVELSMNYITGELFAITFYTEPWSRTNSSGNTINKTEEVKMIRQFNAIAPDNNTLYSVDLSVKCDGCINNVTYSDLNGDGVVEAGQLLAWMNGFDEATGPVGNKLYATIDTPPPDAIIDSMPALAIFKQSIFFLGHGEPQNQTIDHWWRSHKVGRIGSNASFSTYLLPPANPHLINYYVKSKIGLWSPQSPPSTRELVVNKPPTAFINYVKGFTDDQGNLQAIAGEDVELNGFGFDDDGFIQSYEWVIDGTTQSGAIVHHTFNEIGTRNLTLRVKDNKNTYSRDVTKQITVVRYPVLLVHDYLRSPKEMDKMKEDLESGGYEVYAVDLRKPVEFSQDFLIPLKDPKFKTLALFYVTLQQGRQFVKDIKELKALAGATTVNAVDINNKAKKTIYDLRTTLALINYQIQDPGLNKTITDINKQLDNINNALKNKDANAALEIIQAYFGDPNEFGENLFKILVKNYKFKLEFKVSPEIKVTDATVPIPLPEKVVPIIKSLVSTGKIKIPGQKSIFSKTFSISKKGITGSSKLELVLKNIKPIFEGDKAKLTGGLYVSNINVIIDPPLPSSGEIPLLSETIPADSTGGALTGQMDVSFVSTASLPSDNGGSSCTYEIFPELFDNKEIYDTDLKPIQKEHLYEALEKITNAFNAKGVTMTPDLLAAVVATLRQEAYISWYTGKAQDDFTPVEEVGDGGMGPNCIWGALPKHGGCKKLYSGGVNYKGRGYIQITEKGNYEHYCDPLVTPINTCSGSSVASTCGCEGVDFCTVESDDTCQQRKALNSDIAAKIFANYYYETQTAMNGKTQNLIDWANDQENADLKYSRIGSAINAGPSKGPTAGSGPEYNRRAKEALKIFKENDYETRALINCFNGIPPDETPTKSTAPVDFPSIKIHLALSSNSINLKLANKDIKSSAEDVGEKITEIKSETGLTKVDLVGSGMGGLAADYYANYGYKGDVRKVVLIGAPIHGSDLLKYGPIIAKAAIDSLASNIPVLGKILGEIAKAALDLVLGDAVKQMEPGSTFIKTLNLNGIDPAPEWALYKWNPPGPDLVNNNINYLTIRGVGLAIGSFSLPLTLTTLKLTIPLVGETVGVPAIWFGDLLTNTVSGQLYAGSNVANVKVDGLRTYHWWLTKDPEVIDLTDGFLLDGSTTGTSGMTAEIETGFVDNNTLEFALNDIIRNTPGLAALVDESQVDVNGTSDNMIEPVIDIVNLSQSKQHPFSLDDLSENVVIKLQYKPNDVYWNATLDDYQTCVNNVSLNLIQPDLTVINPGSNNNDSIIYLKSDDTLQYIINNPEAGNWQLNVSSNQMAGDNVTCDSAEYSALITFRTALFVGASAGNNRTSYEPGDEVPIIAYVQYNGTALKGAKVIAKITKFQNITLNQSGSNPDEIILYDDGLHDDFLFNDSVYSNNYTNTWVEDAYMVDVIASINTSLVNQGNSIVNRSAGTVFFIERLPELTLKPIDISLLLSSPKVGDNITILAAIHNIGKSNALNAKIEFRVDNETIGEDVINLTALGVNTAEVKWNTSSFGPHNITVVISPFNSFQEKDYRNNTASKIFSVSDAENPVAVPFPDHISNPSKVARTSDPVFFDGSMSHDNDKIVSYVWDTNINDPLSTKLTGVYAPFTGYITKGIYTVRLIVTDAAGNIGSKDFTVNVADKLDTQSPVAVPNGIKFVHARDAIQFSANGSSDNYGISSCTWDTDIGKDTDGDLIPDNDVDLITCYPLLERGYPNFGSYIVKLTIDDVAGNGPVSSFTKVVVSDPLDYICVGDADCDGVDDEEDNCRLVRNSGQEDYDKDGVGDACYCKNIVSGSFVQDEINKAKSPDVICLSTGTSAPIIMNASSTTLDCLGNTISGDGTEDGIRIPAGYNNVTVKNCEIDSSSNGINAQSNQNRIIKNVIKSNINGILASGVAGEISNNLICNNAVKDINNAGSYKGDYNSCNNTISWNDIGSSGCSFSCIACIVPVDNMNIASNTVLCSGEYEIPNGIKVTASGVSLKCDNTHLIGSGSSTGIEAIGRDRVKIKDCEIDNYALGINLETSSSSEISQNRIHDNTQGISVDTITSCSLTGNLLNNNKDFAISAVNSNRNNITNNIMQGSNISLQLFTSGSNTITRNLLNAGLKIIDGKDNILDRNDISYKDGINIVELGIKSNRTTLTGNKLHDGKLNGLLVRSSSNSFINNDIITVDTGYLLNLSYNNNINGGSVKDASTGVLFYRSKSSTLSGVNASDSSLSGLRIERSSNIAVNNGYYSDAFVENSSQISIANSHSDIQVQNSLNINLTKNTAENTVVGLLVLNSNLVNLNLNNVLNNEFGIVIDQGSSNVIVKGNIVKNNQLGIFVNTSGNIIYNNEFANVINVESNRTNTWNIAKTSGINIVGGTYLGGNFWSDYTGIDTTGDTLGDTLLPYNSNGKILVGGDNLPLIKQLELGGGGGKRPKR